MATANVTVGTGDGRIEASNATYATARGAASADAGQSFPSANTGYIANDLFTGVYYIDRIFLPTDFSSIPVDATVTAVTLNLYCTNTGTNTDTDSVALVNTTQPSTSTFTDADFDLFGTTEQATRVNLSALTLNAYNAMTLNATGIATVQAAVTAGGFAKLGLRNGKDIDNTQPTGTNQPAFNMSDNASNKPYFEVTYTVPAIGGFIYQSV